MAVGHQGIKSIFLISFTPVDRTRLRKPPRLMHSRCAQLILMKISLLIFILTVTSLATMAQTSDSLKLRQRNDRLAEQKKRRDSLETVFNLTHNYFEIALELNHEKVSIPDNFQFYATDGQKNYQSNKIGKDRYEFNDLPDSAKFLLKLDTITLATDFIKRNFYLHGARVRFGYFNNILELKERWESGQYEDNFNDWTQTHPYLKLIKDKKIIKAVKRNKIKAIDFIVYSPTSYGDGVNITFWKFRPK